MTSISGIERLEEAGSSNHFPILAFSKLQHYKFQISLLHDFPNDFFGSRMGCINRRGTHTKPHWDSSNSANLSEIRLWFVGRKPRAERDLCTTMHLNLHIAAYILELQNWAL